MKNNIITLNEGTKCFVVDELTYKEKKYIFCFQLDDNEELIEDAVHVFEITVKEDKLITKSIDDFEVASVVNNLFIARQMKENS